MKDTPDKTAYWIQAEGGSPVQPFLMPERDLHGAMSNGIAHLDSEGGFENKAPEEERQWFNSVHKNLKETFNISLLPAIKEVPVRGFMCLKDEDSSPDVNYWDGYADAIGLLEGEDKSKYVIIDWKSTGSKLNAFWEDRVDKRSEHYRYHLTQCLVYARLLMMRLGLDYWPPILIVPFNPDNECIHPRLFSDYPDESKRAIEKYQWSTNRPQRFKKESPLKDTAKEGKVTVTALTFQWWGSNSILFYFYSLYHVFNILYLPISLSMPFA